MSLNNLKYEVVYFIRNANIFSTTIRGVTTATTTASLSGATTYLLNVPNVKNVRSLSVASVAKTYGRDYTLNLDYNDSGTIKALITFVSAQTGTLSITYDYGADCIFADFPRSNITVNSLPRISVDIISESTDAFGIGGTQFITSTLFTTIVYSQNQDQVEQALADIKTLLQNNAKNLFYAPFVKPIAQGPVIKSENRNQTIIHRNQDFLAMFQVNQ